MYQPARDDERTTLLSYVDQQLTALRASIYGLTEEQARATPCRSALSIAGLLKHTAHGMRGAVSRLGGHVPDLSPTSEEGQRTVVEYQDSFVLRDDETATGVLAEFDAARGAYLDAIGATDPDGDATEPPSPWFGIFDSRPIRQRYYLAHQLEEMARHAGHADIIREQVDGLSVPALVLTLAGTTPNAFFQPFVPAPGTIAS